MKLLKKLFTFKRPPDFAIGGWDDPYLLRWYLIPRNPFFNIYLHKFLRDDDDRAMHDHPWHSLSIVLKGKYIEHINEVKTRKGKRLGVWLEYTIRTRVSGNIVFRKATHKHRIELYRYGQCEHKHHVKENDCGAIEIIPAWTLFITGPKIREWGFWCPQGFVHWEKFTTPGDSSTVGKGCDQ